MASLTGYMPSSGIAENRMREWYAARRLEGYTATVNAANLQGRAHVNNQGFFDCLDSVDESRLAYMISELGLYSLQELPDLRLVVSKNASRIRREDTIRR